MNVLFLMLACQSDGTNPIPVTAATVPLRFDTAAHDRLIAQLQDASSTPLHSQRSGGRLHSLTLRVPADGLDAHAQASGFLDAYGLLFGLDARQDLSVSRAQTAAVEQLRYRQSIDGVPVAHAEVLVLLDDGALVGVVSQLAAPPEATIDPSAATVSVEEAISLARAQAGVSSQPVQPPRLEWVDPVLFGGAEPAGLAWRVSFPAGGGVSWISATDGSTMAHDPLRYEAEPDVDVIDANLEDPDIPCWNLWSGTTVCDADGCGANAMVDAEPARLESLDTWSHYLTTHGQLSWDDDNEEIEIIVNLLNTNDAGAQVPNAFSSSYCGQLQFTPGMVVRDVYGHETGHMIASQMAGLLYEGESAAVHEHLGDAFGILYEEALDELDWDIGEDSTIGVMRTPGVDTPLHYDGYVATDSPHSNSLIPSNAFRLLHEGGTASGVVVSALGSDKVSALWFGLVRDRLPSCATFALLRDAAVGEAQAFVDGGQHGFTPQDVCSVKEAFKAIGVGVDQGDLDCDGLSDSDDTDMDGDSIHQEDNCPSIANVNQLDLDLDGIGDVCDDDDDGDGIEDNADPCPDVPEPDVLTDVDGDGTADHCEDIDQDGFIDELDVCPDIFNPSQNDGDGDGIGNACDDDRDGDDVLDDVDNCVGVSSADQSDEDGDGAGDLCDNCLGVPNADQGDDDGDSLGDACDEDIDGDGVANDDDNCLMIYNPGQSDGDGDGIGTFCDGDEMEALSRGLDLTEVFPGGEPAFRALPMCATASCGDWLGMDARATLTMTADTDLWVGLIDSQGAMLGSTSVVPGERATLGLDGHDLYGGLSLMFAAPDGTAAAEATVLMNQDW